MDWAFMLAAGSRCARQRKRAALGCLVRLEPFVQLPVRDLEGLGQCRQSVRVGLAASHAGPRIATTSCSGSSRD